MTALQGVVLVVASVISFIPAVHLASYAGSERFTNLRRFAFLIALWSIVLLVNPITPQIAFSYYLHVLRFPLIFAIVYYCYKTITSYVGATAPKGIDIFAATFFVANFTIALTNNLHLWFLDLSLAEIATFDDILFAAVGPFFYVHAFLSYGFLVYAVGTFYRRYRYLSRKEPYQRAGFLFTVAIAFAILINIVHVFVFPMNIDPTHLTVVAFSLLLYRLVYRKDPHYAMMREGRETLIEEMREMYVCMNSEGEIIEFSKALRERFDLADHRHIDTLLDELRQKAVLYESIEALKNKTADKPYLYAYEKAFSIDKQGNEGKLLLLYDESEFVALVSELEFLKNYDVMTDMYNRNYMESLIQAYDNSDKSYGMIMTDVNGLKLINDNFGHHVGDRLLKRYAAILKEVANQHEGVQALRMGGDEMMLLIPNAEEDGLKAMIRSIEKRCMDEDILERISMSAGYAIRQQGESFEDVLRRADISLYTAKDEDTLEYQKALIDHIKKKSDA